MDQQLTDYLDDITKELQDFRGDVIDRLDNINGRLNGMDSRITVNAQECLAREGGVRTALEKHEKRNHDSKGGGTLKGSGIGAAIVGIIVAAYEAIRRMG